MRQPGAPGWVDRVGFATLSAAVWGDGGLERNVGPGGGMITGDPMHEIGFYTLAGAPESPRELLVEAQHAERIGLGAAFISERLNIKEAATLSGALGAVTSRIGIATAATNHNTRHPVISAAHAMTMHKLTGGRFSLGIGRGIPGRNQRLGLPPTTSAQMADFAWIMRRLWAGETIVDHDGPAGRYPSLSLGTKSREYIPLTITAFGPKTLALAGRVFDSVVLHTFFTEETTIRSVNEVREAAERSGRDPSTVRIWSVLATVGDHLPEELRRRKTVGRLATYLQAYGDLLVRTNRWDPTVLTKFRQDLFVRSFTGPIDGGASDSELEHVAALVPAEWIEPAASGTREQCVAAINAQFAMGVDGVILHGATPWELEPIVEEYRKTRDPKRFNKLKANPGSIYRFRQAAS